MFIVRIAIDALVLMVLLKTLTDEDLEFSTAAIVAAVTSFGTTILGIALSMLLGTAGVFVAAILASIVLGIAISALFGAEIKRAFLISGIFMIVHVGLTLGIWALRA